ncbi:DExH-box splicing factor binding site-domain-containing protein [Phakopsora pachyrhizi]|uniref:DExH-box splicing factor binding site-domain-containing protein n=1 Tax=Phakopsora pachyrhizi TaxID=170000 RepID=A0AAV0AGU8_PHAPC|nr:DExH-box splicing factor binding site-domain-containing protein [Phakopsora pachyrhizi]
MKSLSFKIERSTSMRIDKNGSRSISNNRNQTNRFDDYSDDQPEDSDDDDDGYGNGKNSSKRRIQMITDFDSTRESKLERKEGSSLSIPMLPNKDFRAIHMARKNRRNKKELYKPDSANPLGSTQPSTNHNQIKSNDQEGVDQMNSKAIIGGLKVVKQELRLVEELKDIQSDPTPRQGEEPLTADIENTTTIITSKTTTTAETTEVIDNAKPVERSESGANDTKKNLRVEESIEQRAVRELLSQSGDQALELKELDPICPPTPSEDQETDSAQGSDESADEIAQFRRDISKRPDSSTLEDYERVPVGQFGLALMKGMGWKEGTSTSRRGRVGLVEAYIPQARPTLLGIGAKPLDLEADSKQKGDRSDGKSRRTSKNDKRYVPLLRKVIDQGRAGGQTVGDKLKINLQKIFYNFFSPPIIIVFMQLKNNKIYFKI